MMQAVFNGALASGEVGRFCRRLRRWVLKFSDPLVSWQLNGLTLRIPLSHQLPFYRREFPTYSANLERLATALRLHFQQLTMVDVGANVGDSLALAGTRPGDAFLLVEGDPAYFKLLQENTRNLKDAVCVPAMLSDKAGAVAVRLVSSEGTGKVVPDDRAGVPKSLRTLDSIIEENPRFQKSHLLKVDVDGYDFRVLRGAEGWVRSAQPVLFFEQDPTLLEGADEDPDAVWEWLGKLGYERVFLYDNVGYWLGAFALGDQKTLRQLNAYARQHPGYYYDVAAFAARHDGVRKAFEEDEGHFYKRLAVGG